MVSFERVDIVMKIERYEDWIVVQTIILRQNVPNKLLIEFL